MLRITKMATQDGTFTVYVGSNAVAWELTTSAADDLINTLLHSPDQAYAML